MTFDNRIHAMNMPNREEPDKNSPEKEEIQSEQDESRRGFTLTEFLGIGLIAGGLFNVPDIIKQPVTKADWMMLVVVLALLVSGALLLVLPKILRR